MKYQEKKFVSKDDPFDRAAYMLDLNRRFYQYAKTGEIVEVLRSLVLGADINWTNDKDHKKTAVHIAVIEGQLPTVMLLCQNRANVNLQDHKSWTPMHWAAYCGNFFTPQTVLTMLRSRFLCCHSFQDWSQVGCTRHRKSNTIGCSHQISKSGLRHLFTACTACRSGEYNRRILYGGATVFFSRSRPAARREDDVILACTYIRYTNIQMLLSVSSLN